jgi:hypothetical protein
MDLPGQLDGLIRQLSESNPELYRHLALYLQVLRQVLPHRVNQACFHLATQVHPQRYTALPAESRRLLHRQIDRLVTRCSSLLTVEQLAVLADQIGRERQRRDDHHDREQILTQLSLGGEGEPSSGTEESLEALPPGSVHLAFAPPLSGVPHGWAPLWLSDPGPADRGHGDDVEGTDEGDPEVDPAGEADGAEDGPGDWQGVPMEAATPEGREAEGSESIEAENSLWQPGRLPQEPQQVLLWLDGMELALGRRLRNLSHAINVELLRAGVNRSLLPVSLLDAVLSGQLETLAAPANLLRLPLPFGGNGGRPQAQTMAVLLRSVELELEEPRLRTCRRRLQQHRQEVRRMAQQFRRLQRRLRIHQAEQLWLQDIRPTPTPSD